MIYLYIYIPQISHRFFQEIQVYSYINIKEDSIKGECCETTPNPSRHPFTDDLIRTTSIQTVTISVRD
jgi:hypothetical protein